MRSEEDYYREYGIDRMFLSVEEEQEYVDTLSRIPRAPFGFLFDLKLDSHCELAAFPEEYCAHEMTTWQEADLGIVPKNAGVWSEIMRTPDSELLDDEMLRKFM